MTWLDAHVPTPGWEHRVDLDKLDLSSNQDCVLGQLAPEILGRRRKRPFFWRATDFADVSHRHPVLRTAVYGFVHFELNDRWKLAIQARRDADQLLQRAKHLSVIEGGGAEGSLVHPLHPSVFDIELAEPEPVA